MNPSGEVIAVVHFLFGTASIPVPEIIKKPINNKNLKIIKKYYYLEF